MTPVRGDLAHVALAGKVFVPHYAVPMPHRATMAVPVMESIAGDARPVGALSEGGIFAVLDMAGSHAWGMIMGDAEGEFGPVGYVPLDALEAQDAKA